MYTTVQHLLKDKEAVEAIMYDIQKIIEKTIERINKNKKKYQYNVKDFYNLNLYHNIYEDIIRNLELLKDHTNPISENDDEDLKKFCEWYDQFSSILRNQNDIVKILIKSNHDYTHNPMDNLDRTKFDIEILTK